MNDSRWIVVNHFNYLVFSALSILRCLSLTDFHLLSSIQPAYEGDYLFHQYLSDEILTSISAGSLLSFPLHCLYSSGWLEICLCQIQPNDRKAKRLVSVKDYWPTSSKYQLVLRNPCIWDQGYLYWLCRKFQSNLLFSNFDFFLLQGPKVGIFCREEVLSLAIFFLGLCSNFQ